MCSLMPRILVAAHVPPRPAVKAALLYVRDVVRYQVVAQPVALVHGTPQLAGFRTKRDAAACVAYAVGVDARIAAVRIKFQDVGAIFLRRSGVRISHVGI